MTPLCPLCSSTLPVEVDYDDDGYERSYVGECSCAEEEDDDVSR